MSSARSFLKVGLAAQENTVNHRMKQFIHITEESFKAILLISVLVYRLCSVMNSTSSSSVWGLPGMVSGSSMKGS